MARNVGYLSGTDSATLSQLAASGVNTIPFSNGWDNHGKYIGMVTVSDNLGAIVGYFHKLVAPPEAQTPPSSFLDRARIHKIPVVVVCPANVMTHAKEILGDSGTELHWVTPDQVYDKVMALIGSRT
jgi:CBS domain-containing protein